MRSCCALYVDAGYLLASAATRSRNAPSRTADSRQVCVAAWASEARETDAAAAA